MIRQIAKANVVLVFQYSVGGLVPLLLVPHIVHVIGLAEYGHLTVLMAWGGYGALVVQYAFQLTGPKRVMNLAEDETIASVFVDIVFAKLLLLLTVIPAMTIVTITSTSSESASRFAWTLLFFLPIAGGLNSVWFLQSQNRFLSVCIISIIASLLTLYFGFTFVTAENPRAYDFAVLVSVIGAVFIGLGTLSLSVTSIKGMKYEWSVRRASSALKEGWHLFSSQFISMLYSGSGPIIISFLLDAKAAGAYSVMERAINALMAAVLLTHTAAYPRLASAYLSNRISYWRTLKFILMAYLSITMTIALVTWVLRDPVAQFLYGEASTNHEALLFFGLAWLVLGIFGTALTGHLTISGQSQKVWPLNLKILTASMGLGAPAILLFGNAGWLAALVLSQLLVLHAGLKYWWAEYGK